MNDPELCPDCRAYLVRSFVLTGAVTIGLTTLFLSSAGPVNGNMSARILAGAVLIIVVIVGASQYHAHARDGCGRFPGRLTRQEATDMWRGLSSRLRWSAHVVAILTPSGGGEIMVPIREIGGLSVMMGDLATLVDKKILTVSGRGETLAFALSDHLLYRMAVRHVGNELSDVDPLDMPTSGRIA